MHKQRASRHGPSNCDFSERSRPTRLRVASEGLGGTSAPTIRRARLYASPFARSFEVAHALAREGKRFENPLTLDERYDLADVVVYEFSGFRLDPQQRPLLSASEGCPASDTCRTKE